MNKNMIIAVDKTYKRIATHDLNTFSDPKTVASDIINRKNVASIMVTFLVSLYIQIITFFKGKKYE